MERNARDPRKTTANNKPNTCRSPQKFHKGEKTRKGKLFFRRKT
jgi:hypothetical protein